MHPAYVPEPIKAESAKAECIGAPVAEGGGGSSSLSKTNGGANGGAGSADGRLAAPVADRSIRPASSNSSLQTDCSRTTGRTSGECCHDRYCSFIIALIHSCCQLVHFCCVLFLLLAHLLLRPFILVAAMIEEGAVPVKEVSVRVLGERRSIPSHCACNLA